MTESQLRISRGYLLCQPVIVWKNTAWHWIGFYIPNWLWPVSLRSFLCTLITITQSDNQLLSQSPKLSFQQRLLESEIASHIAPHDIPCTHQLSERLWNKRPLNYLIAQFTSDDENIFPLTLSSKMSYVELKQFGIIKKAGTSIFINKSIWTDTSTVSSCGGTDLKMPRMFVASVQLSHICVA